jgi:inner membrane protein
MASIGHAIVGMAAARWEHSRPRPLLSDLTASMVLYGGLALLPDLDVVGFRFGVPYESAWGHRGASHSLVFALGCACLLATVAWRAGRPVWRTFLLGCLVVGSHGLLDTLTDGGLGAALAWPFSPQRFFAPVRPLAVAPIGRGLASLYGLQVMLGEVLLFATLLLYALWPRARS